MLKYVNKDMKKNINLLPPIKLYSEYLYKTSIKLGITLSEARNKYGLYTIGQFETLLR